MYLNFGVTEAVSCKYYVLNQAEYIEMQTSPTFGNLPVIEGILQFLQFSLTEGSSTARRAFRQWVREALAQ
ncbi:hypothetical protein [Nostoc linckia]|nr:hypothetical protein [Nostoc linckia]